jgi:hypothetical protein
MMAFKIYRIKNFLYNRGYFQCILLSKISIDGGFYFILFWHKYEKNKIVHIFHFIYMTNVVLSFQKLVMDPFLF